MKKWRYKVIMALISLTSLSLLIVFFDNHYRIIKGYLFAVILIVAGYIDIRTKTIPDYIHVLIIIVGLINIDLMESILGLIIVPLPLFIMACIREKVLVVVI